MSAWRVSSAVASTSDCVVFRIFRESMNFLGGLFDGFILFFRFHIERKALEAFHSEECSFISFNTFSSFPLFDLALLACKLLAAYVYVTGNHLYDDDI